MRKVGSSMRIGHGLVYGDCEGGWAGSRIMRGAKQWGGWKLLQEKAQSRNMRRADGSD